jgi:hypothetical protein
MEEADSISKSKMSCFLILKWNARQDVAPKRRALREARRDKAPAVADNSKLQDAVLN